MSLQRVWLIVGITMTSAACHRCRCTAVQGMTDDTIVAILAPDFANTTRYVCAALRRKPSSRSRPLGPSPDAATRSHVDSRRLRLGATAIPDQSAIPVQFPKKSETRRSR